MQKLDPYLNVDPGGMDAFQHGEVFVTDDGGETDLDIGHYERFLDVSLTRKANVTTGQIYSHVIAKERAGGYHGDTVQVIPHITDEIKERMRALATDDVDVIITEIGGTVGDIESQPYLEAARQVRQDIGRENCFFCHVSLVPYIGPSRELKTKPTQHSVAALRSIGIQPDAIVCRSDRPLPDEIRAKVARMCDVDPEAVVTCADAPSIYDIPKVLHTGGLDAYVIQRLGLPFRDVDWTAWGRLLERVHHPAYEVTIALVGKYISLPDSYLSVTEALRAGAVAHNTRAVIRWVASDDCETPEGARRHLADVDGVIVSGGFGERGIEGMIGALRFARSHEIPTLGLCLGFQCMVIEYARSALGLAEAGSAEFDPDTPDPVIATTQEPGVMRLGAYPARLVRGSLVREAYRVAEVSERHRHRYELNNAYRARLEKSGLRVSGASPDGKLAEYVELDRAVHPFYLGTQSNPEFKSRPTAAHPLFSGLVGAALARQRSGRLLEVEPVRTDSDVREVVADASDPTDDDGPSQEADA